MCMCIIFLFHVVDAFCFNYLQKLLRNQISAEFRQIYIYKNIYDLHQQLKGP